MSALVIGKKGFYIGAFRDALLERGFDAVYYQDDISMDELDLKAYGQLNMLILIKEGVKQNDLTGILKASIRLDIPVMLW